MAKRKVYDVSPTGDGDWSVKARGNERASAIQANKKDAVDRARELAKKESAGQVVVRKQDGKIQTEYTYKNDPHPPKG